MDNNIISNSRDYSDFSEDRIRSVFLSTIYECLCKSEEISDSKECLNMIISTINKFLETKSSKSFSADIKIRDLVKESLDQKNQDILKMCIDGVDVDLNQELNPLREALDAFSEKNLYNEKCIINYFNAFLEFSKIIFHEKNFNKTKKEFTKSKTLRNLNTLGKIPFHDKNLEKQGYLLFSVYNPYVAEAIKYLLKDIVSSRKQMQKVPELKELRQHAFIECAKRAFSRFSACDFELYKTDLNCYTDEIISKPIKNLSSVENVKPILLFEKIASYIMHELKKIRESENNIDTLDVNISIIGHTETAILADGTKQNIELSDLLNSIIYWYNRSVNQNDPKLNCIITNIINEKDVFQEIDTIECIENGNRGTVYIQKNDFMEFEFTRGKLDDIINKNDINFLLDCPWLSFCLESLRVTFPDACIATRTVVQYRKR